MERSLPQESVSKGEKSGNKELGSGMGERGKEGSSEFMICVLSHIDSGTTKTRVVRCCDLIPLPCNPNQSPHFPIPMQSCVGTGRGTIRPSFSSSASSCQVGDCSQCAMV